MAGYLVEERRRWPVNDHILTGLLCDHPELGSAADFLIRNYGLLIRNYELLFRNYGLLIRKYELVIRTN